MKAFHRVVISLIPLALASGPATAATVYFPGVSGPYYWSSTYNAGTNVHMMSATGHVCILTEVDGGFRGGEQLAVRVAADGDWYLGGVGGNDISGVAYCFSRSLFKGRDNWLSNEFTVSTRFDCWLLCSQQVRASASTALWWGDAASILNGIGGKFDTYRDSAGIIMSSNGFRSSSLNVSTHSASVWALAYSFFVGVAHSGDMPNMLGSFGGGVSGVHVFTMAPVDQGICYFTEISGPLLGPNWRGSSFARIERGPSNWILTINGASGDLSVRTACLAFDQR